MGAFSSKYWHVWLSAIRSVPHWPAYFFPKHISCMWEKPEYLEKTKHGRLCRLWQFWLKTSPEPQNETVHRTLLYTSLVLTNAGNTAAERLFWRWRAVVWLDITATLHIPDSCCLWPSLAGWSFPSLCSGCWCQSPVCDKWMSEDFRESDPLPCINSQHGLQELDTLLSLYSSCPATSNILRMSLKEGSKCLY